MTIKYYISTDGKYLGGYDGALPPTGAIEVFTPPDHAADVWNGADWETPLSIIADRDHESALKELEATDISSIRAIREFLLANHPGEPLLIPLVAHEASAQNSRGRLKP